MPGLNQKGPMGQGAMTGRLMGRCAGKGAAMQVPAATADENSEEKIPEDNSGEGLGLGRRKGGRCQGLGRQYRFRGGV
ncbi:MAG: DUF5320 domain-containing protein [Bacteroidales bacterium]|nr:DUF5320 domain-containing protein [Bacteroidales bacterium]